MGRFRYQGFLFSIKGPAWSRSWINVWKPSRPSKIISVEVELIHQTEKSVKVRDKDNRVVWVPKMWIVDILKIDPQKRHILITKANWSRVKPA